MIQTRRRSALIAIALALVIPACSSGEGSGGDLALVGTPATISHIHGLGVDATGVPYVATHNGLIKQGDAGWVYASADTNDHMGFSMHAADGIMFRSGHSLERPSLGVDSSRDGASWTHVSDVGDQPVDFHAMTVSFADSDMLWGWDYAQGTFRSTDGGTTWTMLDPSDIENQIYSFAGPPAADRLYAGTVSGLHRSDDAGDTWTQVDTGGQGWVIAVAADPNDAGHLMIFTPQGMKASRDDGDTWTLASGGLPPDIEVTAIAISPLDGETAYAADSSRLFTTTDGGKTWTQLPTA